MRWKTSEIVELLKGIGDGPRTSEPGGDWDTTSVYITVDGDQVSISGYQDPNCDTDTERDDVEIVAVELRNNGSDSRGGLQSKSKLVRQAYYECHDRLSEKGFRIINHYDEIF